MIDTNEPCSRCQKKIGDHTALDLVECQVVIQKADRKRK